VRCFRWSSILLLLAVAPPARAVTLRYALVVGSNQGTDPESGPLPALKHAEQEAERLRDALLRYGGYDGAADRLVLLTHPNKIQLETKLRELAHRVAMERATIGEAKVMFSFFFTGHGLSERLLLADGPVHARDLALWINAIPADFHLAVVDACFSGSLAANLSAKGARRLPGLNLFREMPTDVLGAEGNMWLVSSAPDEASYEDSDIGGVFTHFFTEALGRAESDGPGITLEKIWNYARRETFLYTTTRDRTQSPQQIVSQLKSSAPVYFSFPAQREAKLTLSRNVRGRVILAYEGGHVSDMVEKRADETLTLDAYPGRAKLIMLDGERRFEESIELHANATTFIEDGKEPPPALAFAETRSPLWKKGFAGKELRASVIFHDQLLAVGAGYGFASFRPGLVAPRHTAMLNLRLEMSSFVVMLSGGYGLGRERYSDWGYSSSALGVRAKAGYAVRSSRWSLAFLGGAEAWTINQRFDDRQERAVIAGSPFAGLEATFGVASWLAISLEVDAGVISAYGAGDRSDRLLSPWIRCGIAPLILF
jgi:hypothetical protein